MAIKMKAKAGRKSATLTAEQRSRLVESIEAEQAYRASLGGDLPEDGTVGSMNAAGSKVVSTDKIDRKIGNLQRALKDGTPGPVKNATERHRLEKEAADLETWIKDHALTRKEIDLMPRHGYEYHAAVRKSQKSEVGNPDFAKKCGRYREIMSVIDPENPEATSIDRLRKIS